MCLKRFRLIIPTSTTRCRSKITGNRTNPLLKLNSYFTVSLHYWHYWHFLLHDTNDNRSLHFVIQVLLQLYLSSVLKFSFNLHMFASAHKKIPWKALLKTYLFVLRSFQNNHLYLILNCFEVIKHINISSSKFIQINFI